MSPTETPDWTPADSAEADAEGWDLFECMDQGHPPWELERVDEKAVFESDEEAWSHVREQAARGSGLHQRALAFLSRHAPDEYRAIQEAGRTEPLTAIVGRRIDEVRDEHEAGG